MTLKVCNLQGVTDALFREFLSQPGERQWCSEILHSIAKGERVETKDLLKIPSDIAPLRGSPRGSPVNSPRNHAHLSPLLLPPSPRSPLSPLQPSSAPLPTTVQSQVVPRNSQPVSPPTIISTPTSSTSSTFSLAFSSITRSFSASLANEVRPSAPTNGLGRKHNRRRDGLQSIPSPISPPSPGRQIEAPPPATQ
ncbi:early nodulin-like protein 2, partial [Homarus americanus]|uniref:early nodulin-like protein 2 n=1 Tax=Homarus americanus TaxID=6706 RepID=UPI001C4877B6